jgi:hypothetical protein
MDYRQLMNGAGLGDVLIPKSEFIKEHERLVALLNQSDIPALRKEAKAHKAELAQRGGSGKSQYIARLMAEAKLKHATPEVRKSDYVKGVTNKLGRYVRGSVMDPDVDVDTRMSRADVFDYNRLASPNQSQNSKNEDGNPYGASPFISYHFGNAQSKPRESAIQKAERNEFRKKSARVPRVVEEEEEEEEEKEEKSSQEKRMASIAAYKERKRDSPFSMREVILPESMKRKERRNRQVKSKKREEERKRASMSESVYEYNKGLEREQRAEKKKEKEKQKEARELPKAVNDFRSKAFSDGLPTGMFIGKIEELLKPTKTLVRKGESNVRTPAEQRDVDRQLAQLVKEMDDRGYDPNKLGIKGFNPDKYR